MLKNIILKAGRILLDLSTAIDLFLLAAFLISFTFFIFASELEISQKILACCFLALICFLLFFVIVLIKFVIYLLIDIKDNVAKISGNIKDDNKAFAEFLSVLVTLFFAAIILGLCVSGYMFCNKPVLGQKNNFTNIEIYNTIRNKNKYNDKILSDKFGFIHKFTSNYLLIIDFIPNSNAALSDLKVGDKIIKINSRSVSKLNTSDIEKELKKQKLNIVYERNNIEKSLKLKRSPVYVPNIPPELIPALYFNSTKFKNDYALGYFKVPSNNSYQKYGVICNCAPNNKTITTFWMGTYSNNRIIKEENYLKENNLIEEDIRLNTYGAIMWESLCYLHKQNAKDQKD